jgi:hypothetical protein
LVSSFLFFYPETGIKTNLGAKQATRTRAAGAGVCSFILLKTAFIVFAFILYIIFHGNASSFFQPVRIFWNDFCQIVQRKIVDFPMVFALFIRKGCPVYALHFFHPVSLLAQACIAGEIFCSKMLTMKNRFAVYEHDENIQ